MAHRQKYQRSLYITGFLWRIVLLSECSWRRNERRRRGCAVLCKDKSSSSAVRVEVMLCKTSVEPDPGAAPCTPSQQNSLRATLKLWNAVAKTLSLGLGWSLIPVHWSLLPSKCPRLCITISFRACRGWVSASALCSGGRYPALRPGPIFPWQLSSRVQGRSNVFRPCSSCLLNVPLLAFKVRTCCLPAKNDQYFNLIQDTCWKKALWLKKKMLSFIFKNEVA